MKGSDPKAGIFISYRRGDTGAIAGRIADRLSQHFREDTVFMDVDAIQPGSDFVERIREAVGACDVLIAIIGPAWATEEDASGRLRIDDPHDFVALEIAAALERDVLVIPVLVEGAAMPRADQLPAPLLGLSRRNALEVRHSRFRDDVGHLIETIEAVMGTPEAPTKVARRWVRPALLAGGAAVAVIVVSVVLASGNSSGTAASVSARRAPSTPGGGSGRLFTFAARGTDNTVWYVEPGVRAWASTGGFLAAGNPSIAEAGGHTVIAARGAGDGTIWYTTPGASRWTSTGSEFIGSGDPAVAVSSTGQITIADRGTDNTVWYVEPGVRAWASTGDFLAAGNPSIAEAGGHTVIAARGAGDGTIWHTTPGASRWTSTGSEFIGSGDPAVAVSSTGQITIADRGTDNTVWYVEPGVRAWASTGGFLAAGNPSIAEAGGHTVIAARGAGDGTIWHTTPGASRWTSTGSEFIGSGDPAVAVSSTGQITIADRGTDNTVWYVEPGVRAWASTGDFLAAGNPPTTRTPPTTRPTVTASPPTAGSPTTTDTPSTTKPTVTASPPTTPTGEFASFAGTWSAHEDSLVMDNSGTGHLSYRDLAACPSCSMASAPEGTIEFVLTSVTNGEGTGSVTASSDPRNGLIGAPVEVSLRAASPGQFLDVVIGGSQFTNFCNSTSEGQCGA